MAPRAAPAERPSGPAKETGVSESSLPALNPNKPSGPNNETQKRRAQQNPSRSFRPSAESGLGRGVRDVARELKDSREPLGLGLGGHPEGGGGELRIELGPKRPYFPGV